MKKFYLMIFAVVTLAGMLAISGCGRVSHSGRLHGHKYVDLGLPSGTLWATCNVGAKAPKEYGDYFAWGEIVPKENYSCDTYVFGIIGDYNCSKYNESDGLTVLESSDDAATVNWGAGWRMPTKDEFHELINNCTMTWTTQNGVNGSLFTGPNGNSIFLPAAGDSNNEVGSYGGYWSSSLYLDDNVSAWRFEFSHNFCWLTYGITGRECGRSVRAVCQSRN